MTKVCFLAVAIVSSLIRVSAQDSTQLFPDVERFAAGFHMGPIFAHSADVQNTSGAYPRGIDLLWSWQRNNPAMWDVCACSPIRGIQLSYWDFDTKVLGKSVNAGYVLQPSYRLSRMASISFRGVGGVSFLTNPYNSVTNPTNQSYSTALSVYLSVGWGLEFLLSEKWSVETLVQYQHISNGGLAYPNKGINWPTVGLMTAYRPHPRELKRFERKGTWTRDAMRWDIAPFAMAKRVGGQADGKSRRFLIAGLNGQAAWQVGRINNLSASAELVWDEALAERLMYDGQETNPWKLGVLFGHEFILGRILFSQRIGIYLYQAGNYHDAWYHSWGLVYRFNPHWGAGFNLKAHRFTADYSDLRLVYSF